MDDFPSKEDVRLVAQMAGFSRRLYEEASPGHVDALDRVLSWLGVEVPYRTPQRTFVYTYTDPPEAPWWTKPDAMKVT